MKDILHILYKSHLSNPNTNTILNNIAKIKTNKKQYHSQYFIYHNIDAK